MRFINFNIKNFKGIKELSLDLDKQPRSKIFTLIGLNESGKTTILEAINLFQQDVLASERHKLIPKGEKIAFDDSISIEVKVQLTDKDNKIIEEYIKKRGFKYITKYDSFRIQKEYFFENSVFKNNKTTWYYVPDVQKNKAKKISNLHKDHIEEWHLLITYIKDNLLPKIVYYPNFLFDFPERIFIDDRTSFSKEEDTYKKVVQDILSAIKPNLDVDKQLLDRMKDRNRSNDEALENTLSKMSSIVTQLVFAAWEKIFSRGNKSIEITHDSIVETVKTRTNGTEEITRYFLEFKLREGSNKFYIHERSLGFKWFFAFLLFTEFRKYRLSDVGEVLFLLDEPASNLHSTAQKKLLETFESLVDKSTLIYTTHSHHLINPEWLAGAFIVRNKALLNIDEFDYNVDMTDIEAVLYRNFVANNPEQKDYFQPILDTLDYQPGLLEKVPNIITTEGKNDFYTLRYMNQVYFSNSYANLNFYPSTGADTNIPVISLYVGWNRPIIVLLDGDDKGKSARNKYKNKFVSLLDESIYTLDDIDEKFKDFSLENLFKEEDRIKIVKEFDSSLDKYDKGKFNTAIQSLLFEKKKVDLSKVTVSNFKTVFEFLREKLPSTVE